MIFVDTSFWVALRNMRDRNHEEAVGLLELHGGRGLLTTNHVRGETWTALSSRASHDLAREAVRAMATLAVLHIRFVSETEEERALRWLEQRPERRYSFVDATSFVVMWSLEIWQALAFDGDFSAVGFVELRL